MTTVLRRGKSGRHGSGADSANTWLEDGLLLQLQRRWAPLVEQCCSRFFVKGTGLQDAEQEVWIAAARYFPRFTAVVPGTDTVGFVIDEPVQRALLIRISRNRCAKLKAKIADASTLDEMSEDDPALRVVPVGTSELEREEDRAAIGQILSRFAPRERAIVADYFLDFADYDELESDYGWTRKSLYPLVSRARRLLAQELCGNKLRN